MGQGFAKCSRFWVYGCETWQQTELVLLKTLKICQNFKRISGKWLRCLDIKIQCYFRFYSVSCLNSSFYSSATWFPCGLFLWSFPHKLPRYSGASKTFRYLDLFSELFLQNHNCRDRNTLKIPSTCGEESNKASIWNDAAGFNRTCNFYAKAPGIRTEEFFSARLRKLVDLNVEITNIYLGKWHRTELSAVG